MKKINNKIHKIKKLQRGLTRRQFRIHNLPVPGLQGLLWKRGDLLGDFIISQSSLDFLDYQQLQIPWPFKKS